ncbi:DUF3883 domain-containing protein [Pseudomonas jilinensis]|uniref:Protein NO VEIN C-terminal domain-containing protein n=1 Tax=Pseudomonas jilinensis TaxID=2078689 RepID=A0A396RZS3_9PSED|nr:DUF3883 domain-containing protein [Pseudomonas jilinensis]RHW22118.1 hypothetical protein C2846_03535 [Pseudomonas jilinensis]
MTKNWSASEVEAAVQDYFQMLRAEMEGQRVNKTAHREALRERLDDRSNGSVEFKHQNISAVLMERNLPYIAGYKPALNYQRLLLPEVVDAYLEAHPDIWELFEADTRAVPKLPSITDLLSRVEDAPARRERRVSIGETRASYVATGVDYLSLEASNAQLGELGEQFVISLEKARLISLGKESLADKVEQVSDTIGPSAGFDILSFEADGSDRYIEAKTTKYGKQTPFYVTPNELRFSERNAARYHLYRVFGF